MTDTTVTWLTQEAHDRLQAELAHLSGEGRTEIAERIAAARDEGDLRRTAATTPPARSRPRTRPASASSPKLRNVRIGTPRTTARSRPAWSSRPSSRATR